MNKTKIICTLGPASDNKETFAELVKNGLNVARLNLSHGDPEYVLSNINMVKTVREELNTNVAILMDTRGPEIRCKFFEGGKAELVAGEQVRLCLGDFEGTAERFCITYEDLYKDAKAGDCILVDDGLIELRVVKIENNEVVCEIINGGTVKNRKGINVPTININLPAITDNDESDIILGIKNDIDFVAASFIRSKEDVQYIRNVLDNNGGSHVHIISKIENRTGVDNIEEIIEASDGIMVARGDLGVEIPAEEIPKIQKHIIEKCNIAGIPVIVATQMLESMQQNPRPTRAEVSDVANAVFDGTDAIMLSGESAAGKYPVQSVATMRRIAMATEQDTDYHGMYKKIERSLDKSISNAVSYATCSTAMSVDAAAIVCPTHSGRTARLISMFRPTQTIFATTTNPVAQRQLNLCWGIQAALVNSEEEIDELVDKSVAKAKELKIAKAGDEVVVTAGYPLNTEGTTNLMRVVDVK